MLEGLLEQETGLNPTEIMTDTAGASELVFGLFWLLGYQFSPRLADAGASVFWRMDHDADYGVLNDIARGQSDPRKNSPSVGRNDPDRWLPEAGQSTGFSAGPFIAEK